MNRLGANLTKVRRMIPVAANLDGPLAIKFDLEAASDAAVGAVRLLPTMNSFVHHEGNAKTSVSPLNANPGQRLRHFRLPVTVYRKLKRVYS